MCCFLSVSQLSHIQGRKASSDICKESRSQVPSPSPRGVCPRAVGRLRRKSKECLEISAMIGCDLDTTVAQRHTRLPPRAFPSLVMDLNMSPYYILIYCTDGCERLFCHLLTLPIIKGTVMASEDHRMVCVAYFVLAKSCPSLGCSESIWTGHSFPKGSLIG